jgi:hypothetical protein
LLDIPSSEERKRAAYRQKITECMDRAEELKVLIEQKKGIQNYFHLEEKEKKMFDIISFRLFYLFFCLLLFYKMIQTSKKMKYGVRKR